MDALLAQLVADQLGMVARRQLTARGVDADRVRDQIAAGRWVARTPRVLSTVTGTTLTVEQRRWLAVLHAGPRSMLGNLTAAAHLGLAGWEREEICVLVDDELSFEPVPGVDFFRSRRPYDLLLARRPGIPTCHLEPAVLLWAGYEAPNRAAHGVVAAVMQQRLTSAPRLIEWIDQLRPLRRAKPFKRTVSMVEGGSHSGAELELLRMCRRSGLVLPDRQTRRVDRGGRVRWTDAEWDLPDRGTLVLEVDGGHHLDLVQAGEDAKCSRRLTTASRTVVRCTAYEVTHEPEEVAIDLRALGVPAVRRQTGRVPHNAA